ncbi:glutathione S-transferase family protein [Paracoccus aestuarii]|uniref:Glutathione S-transferase family protein n=1 Tax=Paracoccus aestuarii TaxID=453842 RepID=A0A419A0K2_9RHOB|nr:glutathione S-transferase family protein [Paracoccus aestuarii]RJL06424.1 glutathione S-transferase family protein [Paracoccus aestuarii]WCQ99336.1 glutathione S-transferase family protein [Paracoccus aestuarii]
MPTIFHSPDSRSDGVMTLLRLMGVADDYEIREVTIPRQDGSGARDPANPHPEGKVPYLVDGADHVRERGAIMLWLTDRHDSPLGRPVGHPQRGRYLSWLFHYQGVMEPVMILDWVGIAHPAIQASLRDMPTAMAQLEAALAQGPFLLGQEFSAADILCSGVFLWFGDQMELSPAVRDWAARCGARMAD